MFIEPSKKLSKFLEKEREKAKEREVKRRAQKLNLPYLDPSSIPVEVKALEILSFREAKKAKVCPFRIKENIVFLALVNPNDPETKKTLIKLKSKNYQLENYLVSEKTLNYLFGFYKYITPKADKNKGRVEIEEEKVKEYIEKIKDLESFKKAVSEFRDVRISKFLELILAGSLNNRASDIHLEIQRENCRFRIRIDGELYDVYNFSLPVYRSILSRIKLLSGLKLNVRDRAQDGRFSLVFSDREIEIRVSSIPSEYGETLVLRLLDPALIDVSLENLGLRESDLAAIRVELKRPNGIILNTGPTGSGKTTTLYAFLKKVYNPGIKIVTIEDPIEYHISGIEQTQIKPEVGYTFASALRSILRQDPDVILVGEIRDKETAETAAQASLTGHLVFSTLHTNQAAGAIPRLMELGVSPSSIAPSLNIIIAQRLIRRLCPVCKKEIEPSPEIKKKILNLTEKSQNLELKEKAKNFKIFQAVGCSYCQNLGYKGRIGIFEILKVTPELKEKIHQELSEMEILKLAKKEGMTTLKEDGLIKVLDGISTIEELEKAVGPL